MFVDFTNLKIVLFPPKCKCPTAFFCVGENNSGCNTFRHFSSELFQKEIVALHSYYIECSCLSPTFISTILSFVLQIMVSSPLKLEGVLVFQIWTKKGVMKNSSEIVVQLNCFSSVFLQKIMFSLQLEYFFFFFLSGKYLSLL